MNKRSRNRGQGLVEFALILPIVLLVLVGTIEVSRILFVYSNLTNAAREGARYGMVDPGDYSGINTRVLETLILTLPENVSVNIKYDTGPGGIEYTDPTMVVAGHRVIVETTYHLNALTPLFEPFVPPDMTLNSRNVRTVQSVKGVGEMPTPLPTPTPGGPTPTPGGPTATSTPLPPPTATPTITPTVTTTPVTPTPTPLPPIIIDKPVYEDEVSVTGTAAANQQVTLRIIQTGWQETGLVDGAGNFVFDNLSPLVAGHTVIVQGYGSQDLTVVQPLDVTPTPTATPADPFILVNPTCTDDSVVQVTVNGYNFPSQAKDIYVYWDKANPTSGDPLKCVTAPDANGAFSCSFQVIVTQMSDPHIVSAEGWQNANKQVAYAETNFYRPCDTTPTPTPTPDSQPDLYISGMAVKDAPPLGTYDTLHVEVNVVNSGTVDIASLFWVDLYADADAGTPLTEQASEDYVALNALAAGSNISFTMYVPGGFDTLGEHTLMAMVDTWNQIQEANETNNEFGPITVTIEQDNPMPTPTPTPEFTPGPTGAIEGITYLGGIAQSNVSVYVYDADGRLWGSGRSDINGNYAIDNIPAGDYIVVGQLRLGDSLYQGQVGPVTVVSGETTYGADIDLVSLQ
jgi:hypothetical protein